MVTRSAFPSMANFVARPPQGRVHNLPLTEKPSVSPWRVNLFPTRVGSVVAARCVGMSARKETYRVYSTHEGWLVQTGGGCRHLGPYADQEHAIAIALVAVRRARPSRLRISNCLGEWRAEVVYGDPPPSCATAEQSMSADILRGRTGAPHGSP